MPSWQRDFASGLIVLVPLLVTLIFLAWIYSHLARVPIPLDHGPVRVLLTLVIFVLLSFSVGYLMRTALGSVLETALDDLMNQLPGLRVIYNASKMAVETALGGTSGLQTPVRLEVWDGLRMTAFKTGNKTPDGREILFMPTAPNITTGFVIEVEEDRYVEIEDSVEDSLTRLLSAGFGTNQDDAPIQELLGEQTDGAADGAEVTIGEATEPGSFDDGTESERADTDEEGGKGEAPTHDGTAGGDSGSTIEGEGEPSDEGEDSNGVTQEPAAGEESDASGTR